MRSSKKMRYKSELAILAYLSMLACSRCYRSKWDNKDIIKKGGSSHARVAPAVITCIVYMYVCVHVNIVILMISLGDDDGN